jgi:osmotically-inducible protein OsmY
VTLSGRVHEARQKEKAGQLAKKVHGVKSVVNNIKVEVL